MAGETEHRLIATPANLLTTLHLLPQMQQTNKRHQPQMILQENPAMDQQQREAMQL